MTQYRRVAGFKTARQLREHVAALGLSLPCDDQVAADGPLSRPCMHGGRTIGNRFAILPMEGWDGTTEGAPTDLTRRRWRRFGDSGAKLVWGGEAVAVRHDGRANPNQLVMTEANVPALASLREELVAAHVAACGTADDLLVGLQLTHSGRFCRPNAKDRLEPRTAYEHPLLDARFGCTAADVLNDDDLDALTDDFVAAAERASRCGFDFVDVKHCHGYLGHELLSAIDRPGRYGGDPDGRTHFLGRIVDGVLATAPTMRVGVRLSIFDFLPFQPGEGRVGRPMPFDGPYPYAFGGTGDGLSLALDETSALLAAFRDMGVTLVCTTAGSPYYNPHIQRPAMFPPSDGYLPPEDPLVGVVRQIEAVAELKRRHPEITLVGSGYSYLQEFLPHVGQAVIDRGMTDFVGLGRMVLSYPELPRDVLAGRPLARKKICRTFSDCTTAPRNGLISGCYPLDPHYKAMPEHEELHIIKSENA